MGTMKGWVAVLLFACGCAGIRAENFTRQGREQEKRGRLDRAITLYRKAVAADPKNAEAKAALDQALIKGRKAPEEPVAVTAPPPDRPTAPPAVTPQPPAAPSPEPKIGAVTKVLNSIKGADVDAYNADAFYEMGMQLKGEGKFQEAATLLNRFVSLEKTKPSPREKLLKDAEKALFEMDVPVPPEAPPPPVPQE